MNPGVYMFHDTEGTVIYVGKAKALKNRVSSYFNKNKYESGKTRLLASKVVDIKFVVTDTEADALFLENNLIKEHQPRYNMQLKDDKSFPSITIKNERFPRIFPTRRLIKDGSEYFGPYSNVKKLNAVLDLIKKLYPIRTCKYDLSEANIEKGKFKVCLEYHLGNCLGPCVGKQEEADYAANVSAIRQILKGDLTDLVKVHKKEMDNYAASLKFEEAASLKKKLDLLENFQARSTIVNPNIREVDVFGIISDLKAGYVSYMKVNDGVIVHSHTMELRKRMDESDADLLAHAVVSIRERVQSDATTIFLPIELEVNMPDLKVMVPQRGDKKKLVDLSVRNARFFMRDRHKQVDLVNPSEGRERVMRTLQDDLRLKELPVHIECFDNSNIQGTNPSSACVVFKDGKPSKDDYRKFNIKTVEGPDDFASMYEVVYRRYKRLSEEGQSLPQLIIIDGGKGQLSSSVAALKELDLFGKVAIIGIAKKLEEIFFPGDSFPLYIDKRSESLKLIQHLRNEAHRFSLAHHRNRRSKSALQSELTEIKGVGPGTAQTLITHFKSVKRIREAKLTELQEAVNLKVAQAVWQHFNS